MTSIIRFRALSGGLPPLAGANPTGPAHYDAPHCYLLEVDQFTFLLDCGWDAKFNLDLMHELKKNLPKIDAVLLSYPDNLHLGALPYAVGQLGLNCPIYATVPVYKMGQMFLYDTFQSRHNSEEFDLFTLDEVDKTFEMITQLKYNQTVNLKGKGEGLSITPLPAGHMLGGSLWKIVKDGEEDIVYAVDFNHKKEQHLNSCDLERIQRPSLLITDAYNATQRQVRRRNRDENLMTQILQTLRTNGNVLVCVDTAGRVLELAHMIDHLWQIQDSGLLAYSLALVNNVSYNVMEFAKSQIEWMSEKLMRTFEGRRNNPFQFKHLKLCHSMSEVNKVPSPKVVLASMPDMECGFSRELFTAWCTNPKNTVILTSRASEGTLAHDLMVNGSDRTLELEVRKRVKLAGTELEEFRRKEKEESAQKQKQSDPMLALDDEDSSDEEMDFVGVSGHGGGHGAKHDIILRPDQHVNKTQQQTGFFKTLKNKYPMYPFHEEKIKWDDYGEIIKPEEWMDASADSASASAASALAQSAKSAMADKPADPVDDPDYTEVPTKCVSHVQAFKLRAQIHYIDFEGRSDGESIIKMVQQVKPRRTIIVRGQEDSCRSLADYCRQHAVVPAGSAGSAGAGSKNAEKVFIPRNGELVDATTESFIYQVRLPESLVSRLYFGKGKDGLLAWIDGIVSHKAVEVADLKPLKPVEEEDKSDKDKDNLDKDKEDEEDEQMEVDKDKDEVDKEEDKATIPTLLATPELDDDESEEEDKKSGGGHQSVFVNELKLSDFKMILTRHGISSEFQGGVLFCGRGGVALRRHDSGRVTIEGTVCDEYYAVRGLLYEQYAIL